MVSLISENLPGIVPRDQYVITALFSRFQCADSELPKLDGPLLVG